MKSLIKSINTNCCYDGSAMIKNKSEKELSFDIRSKSFSIIDITDIRKKYQKDHFVQTALCDNQISAQPHIQPDSTQNVTNLNTKIVKVSSNRRAYLLSNYCQKVSKITQQQFSLEFNQKSKEGTKHSLNKSFNIAQKTQVQIKKRKIQVTCGKRNLNNFGQIIKKQSQGYLKIDGNQRISNKQQMNLSLKNDKRFSVQIEPNQNTFNQEPKRIIEKPFASRYSQKESFSMCTTIENSQNYSIINKPGSCVKNSQSKVYESEQMASQVVRGRNANFKTVNRKSYEQVDKENDMNIANQRTNFNEKSQGKKYNDCEATTTDRQQKVTQSILFTEDISTHRQVNLTINSQLHQQTAISDIKRQIHSLQQDYGHLKVQQSFLLNQLYQHNNEFEAKYELLLKKKAQCETQEKLRRSQIDEIKQILDQRAKSIYQGKSNQFY